MHAERSPRGGAPVRLRRLDDGPSHATLDVGHVDTAWTTLT